MQGVKNWFAADPVRVFFLVRIGVYVVAAVVAGQALDPDRLIELIGAVFGVTAVDAITTGQTRKRTEAPGTLDIAAQVGGYGEIGAWAVRHLKTIVATFVPGGSIAKALEVVAPLLAPYTGAVLTPAIQTKLTSEIHAALRAANLLRRVDLG